MIIRIFRILRILKLVKHKKKLDLKSLAKTLQQQKGKETNVAKVKPEDTIVSAVSNDSLKHSHTLRV